MYQAVENDSNRGLLGASFTNIWTTEGRSYSPSHTSRNSAQEHDDSSSKYPKSIFQHDISSQHSNGNPVARRQYYSATILRRISLCLFVATFVVLSAVLGFLRGLSVRDHGISNVDTQLYYVWTYGPTALLTLIAAFWHSLQFRTMLLAPWQAMFNRTVSAEDSILIDYPSMWNVPAFMLAIQKRHFRVVLAMIGTLFIGGLIVVSTALFTTQINTFDSSTTMHLVQTIQPPGNLNLTAIYDIPYTEAFLNLHLNTTETLGTKIDTIYEVFLDTVQDRQNWTSTFIANTTYTAKVSSLTSLLECEPATVIDNPRQNESTYGDPLAMVSDTCTDSSNAALLNYKQQGGDYGLWANLGCCSCGPDDGHRMSLDSYGLQEDNGQDWRLFVYANRFKAPQTTRNTTTIENSDFIAYICTPKLRSRLADVTLGRDVNTDQILSNLTFGEDAPMPSLNTSSAVQLLLGAVRTWTYFTGRSSTAYNFLLVPGDDGHIDKFFNTEYLKTTIESNVPRIMAQVANTYFTSSGNAANSSVDGNVARRVDRLVVRDVSFGLTMAGLLILALISVFFLVIGPILCCSRDPSSLAAMAALLSRSAGLKNALLDSGNLSSKAVKEKLSKGRVSFDGSSIHYDGTPEIESSSTFGWWSPVSSTLVLRTFIICAPIVLIILLEVSLQMSNKHGKLTTVVNNGVVQYVLLYLPPALVLGVRLLFGMVDHNSRVFQIFFALLQSHAPASSTLLESLRGRPTVLTFFRALRKRYWAVVASTFAMFFGPLLSIVVASLFVTVPSESSHLIVLRQTERWNFSDPNENLYYAPKWYPGIDSSDNSLGILTYLGQDGVVPSMILNYNLSFPTWTSSEFVLPSYMIEEVPVDDFTDVTVQARVIGIRPNLNCKEVTAHMSYWTRPQTNVDADTILTNITYAISGLGETNDNCGYADNFTISGGLWFTGVNPQYYGESVDTRLSTINLTTRNDCPTRLFFLNDLNDSSVKAIACRPRLEEVEVEVTLNYPDFSFAAANPPQIVSRPKVLYDGFFNSSHDVAANDLDLENSTNTYTPGINPFNSAGLGDVFPSVNEVENAILGYGGNTFYQIPLSFGTSYQDLYNDPQLMMTQMQRLYGIIIGQILRSYGMEKGVRPHGTDSGQAPIQATLLTSNERRDLVQNAIVTRTLESLLALMTVCMFIAMMLQHTHRIVPKDPEVPGNVMSLLAGAGHEFWRLFDSIQEVEWMSDKEMVQKGIFNGLTFRMGWSADQIEGQRGNRGYIAVAKDDLDTAGFDRGKFCVDIQQASVAGGRI